MENNAPEKIGIVGGGVMGRGIALLALRCGHAVRVVDSDGAAARAAAEATEKRLRRLADKGDISAGEKNAMRARFAAAGDLSALSDCAVVIEAVPEDLALKRAVFARLENIVASDCLLATNTSTLSVTAIAAPLAAPHRLVGMHFFNPAPVMPLVEVVRGLETDADIAARAAALARRWKKKPVFAASMPGFIVNRAARPFYCEALALLEDRRAAAADIDAALTGSGVFPMGAFALIDLIGVDTNLRNTLSLYNAYYQEKRFRPSPLQREYVDGGRLGKKSGRGFYQYDEDGKAAAAPALYRRDCPPPRKVLSYAAGGMAATLARRAAGGVDDAGEQRLDIDGVPLFISDGRYVADMRRQCGAPCVMCDWMVKDDGADVVALAASADCGGREKNIAAGFFQSLGMDVVFIADTPGMIVHRMLCLLINEALLAVMQGVCNEEDCDAALAAGMNFSPPPLTLARRLGYGRVLASLQTLRRVTGEDKFRPSAELYRRAMQSETERAA